MAITISGENNNDRILAADGVLDSISGINATGIVTATSFTGDLTGNVTGNVTGNINNSTLLLQTGGSERFRITGNNELGIAGANYGSSGQVLTSGGSGSAVSWATPAVTSFTAGSDNRVVTATSGAGIKGEANLNFDGTGLGLVGHIDIRTGSSINTNVTGGGASGTLHKNTTSGEFAIVSGGTGGNNYLTFYTSANAAPTEKLRITHNGYVGISTGSPGRMVHIFSRNTGHPLILERGDGSNTQIEIKAAGVTRGYWGSSSTANFLVYDNDTSDIHFVVNQTGKVGINETSPLGTLHIKEGDSGLSSANANADTVFIENSANAGITIATPNSNTGYLIFADPEDDNIGQIIYRHGGSDANSMGFFVNASERLRIDSSGRLLLGTTIQGTSGADELTISTGGSTGITIRSGSSNDGNLYFAMGTTGNETYRGFIQYEHSNNALRFGTNATERLRITSGGNIGVAGATGTDYSLLDGMVINTANGSAGLIINSSSSSHNAYLSFGYGSGSGTSHADQYSAYIGRVGDDTLIFGTQNNIRASFTSSGHFQLQGGIIYGDDNASNVLKLQSTSGNSNHSRIEIGAIQSSDNGGIHFYTAGSSAATRHMTLKGTSGNLGIGIDNPASKVHIYEASNDPYIRVQRGATSNVTMGGFEIASSNGNGNNVLARMIARGAGNSGTTGSMIFQVRDQGTNREVMRMTGDAVGAIQGNHMLVNGNQVCVFGSPLGTSGTQARDGNITTYNTVYEHSNSSYRTTDNGMFGGTFVVGGNANYWYPVWFSQPTNCPPQELWINKYVHNYATWDGSLNFRATLCGSGYGAYTVQQRVHFYSSSSKEFIGKIIYTGHNNAFLVCWMRGGGRSYGWGTTGGNGIQVNVGDDGNSHNLGPGNTSETYITNNLSIPQGYEQAMTTSGQHQQSDGF